MNRFNTRFLKHTLFLLMVSLSLPLFGQKQYGPPKTRKVADAGQNDPCDIKAYLREDSYTVGYEIEIEDLSVIDGCDLYAGAPDGNGSTTYLPVTFSPYGSGYIAYIIFTVDAAIFDDACSEGYTDGMTTVWYDFGLFCFDGTNYLPFNFILDPDYYENNEDFFYNLDVCCLEPPKKSSDDGPISSDEPGPAPHPTGGYTKIIDIVESNALQLDKEGSNDWSKATNSLSVDYYVFDISGNQRLILKGIDRKKDIQQSLRNSGLPTGIYFIRFVENDRVTTKKIFKQ